MSNALVIHPDIQDALDSGRPMVALESTVITHGLPYPANLKVTLDMIEAVSQSGAIAAVLAVYDGVCHIGLDQTQLESLAQTNHAMKCSIRDLPIAMQANCHGSTTVAATMHLARLAGIQVFATGGIGGVHRGAAHDVSADLTALEHTSMVVVCSGAKSILDLPATREELETRGVVVAGWHTNKFPAFYALESGLETDTQVNSAEEAAALYRQMQVLSLESAMLLTVPVPAEKAMEAEDIDPHIEAALSKAAQQGVTGKDITPFLLEEIRNISGNRSMDANTALLIRNASVAGQVASALARLAGSPSS